MSAAALEEFRAVLIQLQQTQTEAERLNQRLIELAAILTTQGPRKRSRDTLFPDQVEAAFSSMKRKAPK